MSSPLRWVIVDSPVYGCGNVKVFYRDVHNQILVGIQDLLDKQRIHMKREEASILRDFKGRMKVLQDDLSAERSSDSKTGDSKWLDKAVSQ